MNGLVKKAQDICVQAYTGAQVAKVQFVDGVKNRFGERRGQAMLEYGIILVVVVLLLLSTMTELGQEIQNKLKNAITSVKSIGGTK